MFPALLKACSFMGNAVGWVEGEEDTKDEKEFTTLCVIIYLCLPTLSHVVVVGIQRVLRASQGHVTESGLSGKLSSLVS